MAKTTVGGGSDSLLDAGVRDSGRRADGARAGRRLAKNIPERHVDPADGVRDRASAALPEGVLVELSLTPFGQGRSPVLCSFGLFRLEKV